MRPIRTRPTALTLAASLVLALSAGTAGAADALTGPTMNGPSQGARDIMKRAERQPSVTKRFGFPQLSQPIQIDLPPAFGRPPEGDFFRPPRSVERARRFGEPEG